MTSLSLSHSLSFTMQDGSGGGAGFIGGDINSSSSGGGDTSSSSSGGGDTNSSSSGGGDTSSSSSGRSPDETGLVSIADLVKLLDERFRPLTETQADLAKLLVAQAETQGWLVQRSLAQELGVKSLDVDFRTLRAWLLDQLQGLGIPIDASALEFELEDVVLCMVRYRP